MGYKTPQAAAHPYDAAKLGAYDAMFHTHSETQDDWATNLGQTVYMGNSAVQQSSSGLKDYYWEIYNIMGDPSLSTYLKVPSAMSVTHTEYINPGTSTAVSVSTGVAYAYVGISWNNQFQAGGYANSSGVFNGYLYPSTPREYTLTVTAQNRITYTGTIYAGHIWTGAISTTWNIASNWNYGTVPGATNYVSVPSGLSRYPVIGTAAAICHTLSVDTGASVHLYTNSLTVANNVYMGGYLIMATAHTFDVDGSFYWQAGSMSLIANASAQIFCAGNMTFESGSNIQFELGYLEFDGPNTSYLYNYSPNTRFYNIRSDVEVLSPKCWCKFQLIVSQVV